MVHSWSKRLFRHVRIGFGHKRAVRTRNRMLCTLLCLNRVLFPVALPEIAAEMIEHVMLEDVEDAFHELAKTNATYEYDSDVEGAESCEDDENSEGGISKVAGVSNYQSVSVVQEVDDDEDAAQIHPEEATLVSAQVEAGFIEHLVSSDAGRPIEHNYRTPDDAGGAEGQGPSFDVESPFTRLMMLNFSRHPQAFVSSLMHDESLREVRETLDRARLPFRLESGAFVVLSPDQHPLAMRAVRGRRLTASHVIVSEQLEPVVRAAVDSSTSHRDNVRVRHVQDLGFAGEEPLVVERTFLSIPRPSHNAQSVAHSTAVAHGVMNPRCFIAASDI